MAPGLPLLSGRRSARARVLKHLSCQKAAVVRQLAATGGGGGGDDGDNDDPNKPKGLDAGMMRLYSYYEPSLQGGEYTITVKQDVHTSAEDGPVQHMEIQTSTQKFNVNAPRFTLPPGIVHSTYPPQGLGDHNNVLPHIVFKDPHLPWEQQGSPRQDEEDEQSGKEPKTKVPWVALLTFTEDELKLSDQELQEKATGGPGLFPNAVAQDKSTFSVQLTIGDYLEMGGDGGKYQPTVTAPIIDSSATEKIDRDIKVDVIFPTATHVQDLVAEYDGDGARVPIKPGGLPDLSRYKWLAHVRNVNTKNVAGAGSDDNGLFSVVLAHRSGPLDLKTARPVICHLVTLEGFEVPSDQTPHITLPLDSSKRVALVSLYSWTYMCLPPEDVNFLDSLRHIGFAIEDGNCWLRAPDEIVAKITGQAKGAQPTPSQKVAGRLGDRLKDGFCLQRYRLQTGEETVAFYRGPFTPTYVKPIEEAWWPYQSNFSSDYQVVDRELGIMDITYSSAWQLGRTVGIADQAFTAALVRLRGVVQTTGRRGALKDLAAKAVKSKSETLSTVPAMVARLSALTAGAVGTTTSDPLRRFSHTQPEPPKFEVKNSSGQTDQAPREEVQDAFFRHHVLKTARLLCSARVPSPQDHLSSVTTAPSSDDDEVYIPWSDITVPTSSDWQIVQTWILENMFFKNIPAHYFIPDPSFLPPESIRFFYVDPNWVDSFIDGALSIGNHLDRDDDVVRQAFKWSLNTYFKTPYSDTHPSHPDLKYTPQIPCFGFLLRSAIVTAFPDLEIHAPWSSGDDEAAGVREPTLRFEAIAKDTLLCLFDRMPGSPHWDPDVQITLSQPPHQQCFRVGTDGGLTSGELEVEFPPVYTTDSTPAGIDRYAPLRTIKWLKGGSVPRENVHDKTTGQDHDVDVTDPKLPKAIFDWDSRMTITNNFANASQSILTNSMTHPASLSGTTAPPDGKYYDDDTPTSAMVGTVLTSFISKMKIELPLTAIVDPTGTGLLPDDYTKIPRQIRTPAPASKNPDDFKPVPPDNVNPAAGGGDPAAPRPGPAPPSSPTPAKPHRTAGLPGRPSGFKEDDQPLIPPSEIAHPSDPTPIFDLRKQFAAQLFALGTGAPLPPFSSTPTKIALPRPGSADDHPIDLVVSLKRLPAHDVEHHLQLFCVTVQIPIGSAVTDLLSAGTTPTAARMLQNVRFNVHVSPLRRALPGGGGNKTQDYLVFLLIPRSRGKLVPLWTTSDLSFVICQVNLNGLAGMSSVVVKESYRWQIGDDRKTGYRVSDAQNGMLVQKTAPL
ncbi:hypothetical protein QBC46DRAFT_450354 [Diplogelasinospora grovesii]|uniref:Uncharacterized protein n=1 Tax=Diplogelasinospora grovesii TaxID=303347 RepID=A0AAN6N5F5_9PEZI|nr:hypothetical protein QBC46DRAFT_450354 [Diplogelasinospora grovesii]